MLLFAFHKFRSNITQKLLFYLGPRASLQQKPRLQPAGLQEQTSASLPTPSWVTASSSARWLCPRAWREAKHRKEGGFAELPFWNPVFCPSPVFREAVAPSVRFFAAAWSSSSCPVAGQQWDGAWCWWVFAWYSTAPAALRGKLGWRGEEGRWGRAPGCSGEHLCCSHPPKQAEPKQGQLFYCFTEGVTPGILLDGTIRGVLGSAGAMPGMAVDSNL